MVLMVDYLRRTVADGEAFGGPAILGSFVASERRGRSEDPWLCVPDFGQVCLCRLFVVVPLILRVARQVLIVNITRLVQATGNVGYGSAADPQKSSTPGAAFEREPAVQKRIFESRNLNVCFSQ